MIRKRKYFFAIILVVSELAKLLTVIYGGLK